MSRRTILVGLVLGLVFARGAPAASGPAGPQTPAALAKAKVEAAAKAFETAEKSYATGQSTAEQVYLWSRRWLEARRDLADNQAERAAAVEAHLGRLQMLRKTITARYKVGNAPYAEVTGAEFYVVEAELWLAQAKTR
jgi:outer membrane protein TolC